MFLDWLSSAAAVVVVVVVVGVAAVAASRLQLVGFFDDGASMLGTRVLEPDLDRQGRRSVSKCGGDTIDKFHLC